MTDPGSPTLDQLRVFAAVAETGSFSAAARRLHRAQSAVSYAIGNLEAMLGLELFERGHRKPLLTEAGRAVLADARRVGRLVDDLRARASGLHAGLEAEIGLVVDVMFPTARLVAVLESFAKQFPTVALRLRIEALGAVVDQVLERACGLGISGPMGVRAEAVERRPLCQIELIPVCAPTHPLARLPSPPTGSALHEHIQLVLSDRSRLTDGQEYGVVSPRTWRLGDLGAKHALLRAGLGWGNMPAHMVCDDLGSGRLVRIAPERPGILFQLLLIHRADTPPGPATSWLAERFSEPAEVG